MVIFLECTNSEGLPNFAWSHDGFWITGGTFMGSKDTVLLCAKTCTKDHMCVAINYYYSGDMKGACYLYYNSSSLTEENKKDNKITKQHMKAYIKCQGSQ